MARTDDYLEINRASWNQRTDAHLHSEVYDVDAFRSGKSSLNEIELDLLGDVRGLRILHLQCHFGQDSLSLARLGAQVTGVDLSDRAIRAAQELATQCDLDATFVCRDLYSAHEKVTEEFDVVFTSYGTIGWLPDMPLWAAQIARFLKPGGRFVFAEFHPVVWMFDDHFQEVSYDYFNTAPIHETEEGTYADRNAPLQLEFVTWNHPISEVLTALLEQGLRLRTFREFNYSPYPCFQHVVEPEPGKYRIAHLGSKIPMVYALEAIKG